MLPQHVAQLGCDSQMLGLVDGLERAVTAAEALREMSPTLWQELVAPRSDWQFTVTANNVPLLHQAVEPWIDMDVDVEVRVVGCSHHLQV
jgi:hypothetical protein